MKTLVTLTIAILFSQIGAAAAFGQTTGHDGHHPVVPTPAPVAEKPGNPSSETLAAFEKIKSLVGDWEARDGTAYGGKPIRITYRLVSQGSGVMETYAQVGVDIMDMVTVYHLDGDNLVFSHFCAVNNQVRMRAELPITDPKEMRFTYVDARNLSVSNREVVTNLVINFQDSDHFTQKWTWRSTNDEGKTFDQKAIKATYHFTRRK